MALRSIAAARGRSLHEPNSGASLQTGPPSAFTVPETGRMQWFLADSLVTGVGGQRYGDTAGVANRGGVMSQGQTQVPAEDDDLGVGEKGTQDERP
jgi:hypothetical protein